MAETIVATILKDGTLKCNEFVETKSLNMLLLRNFKTINNAGTIGPVKVTCDDNIFKFTVGMSNTTDAQKGWFISESICPTLVWEEGKSYTYKVWVKFPKTGQWMVRYGRDNKSGYTKIDDETKWYQFKFTGKSSQTGSNEFVFYTTEPLTTDDFLLVRDLRMYELPENFSGGATRLGQFKSFEFSEFEKNYYELDEYIISKDGADWLRFLHHNNQSGTILFTDESEALDNKSENKYSILYSIADYRNKEGKFEFLLEYPYSHENQYNRWIQTEDPTQTIASDVGFVDVHSDWSENSWSGLRKDQTGKCFLTGSSTGEPYYQICPYESTGSGILGPSGEINTEVDLYVRIDNLDQTSQICKLYKRRTVVHELIEKEEL